jgi:hypothetical protein
VRVLVVFVTDFIGFVVFFSGLGVEDVGSTDTIAAGLVMSFKRTFGDRLVTGRWGYFTPGTTPMVLKLSICQ